MTKKNKTDGTPNESFENLMGHIEKVVQSLEKGELPLEESLKAYENGIQLINKAQSQLGQMETRIEKLKSDGSTTPLNTEEMAAVHSED